MKITVLIDNIEYGGYAGEWGLAICVDYRGKKILLDTGSTGLFTENAEKMGVNLEDIDFGVLSHAHYDHSGGMAAFFEKNSRARFYLRKGCSENCYRVNEEGMGYIGIGKGWLQQYADRIIYADGDYELMPGVKLIPHKTPNLEAIGRKAKMFRLVDGQFVTEKFEHEQSLVFETEKGLVIFNSCSHGGADNIIREVAGTYPDQKVYALVGGFHLSHSSEEDARALAIRIRETGIDRIITGHCTGDAAYEVLKEELGDRVEKMHSGLEIII